MTQRTGHVGCTPLPDLVGCNDLMVLREFVKLTLEGLLSRFASPMRANVARYLQRQIGQMQALADARTRLARLRPIDVAVLDRIQTGDRLFGKESERFIAGRIGVDQVNPKSINDSIDKPRKVGLVIRVERGQYRIEDSEVATLIVASRDVAPPRLSDAPDDVS